MIRLTIGNIFCENWLIEYDQSWSKLIEIDRMWSKLIECDQNWSNVIKIDWMWSKLIECDRIWSKLIECDQNWSKLIEIDRIWTLIDGSPTFGVWQFRKTVLIFCANYVMYVISLFIWVSATPLWSAFVILR
jgi:hypothetical protein